MKDDERLDENLSEELDDFILDMQKEYLIQSGQREEFILYSEEEYDLIVEAALIGIMSWNDEQGLPDLDEDDLLDEVHKVVTWAEQMATGYTLVEAVLRGEVIIRPGDPIDANDMILKLREEGDFDIMGEDV